MAADVDLAWPASTLGFGGTACFKDCAAIPALFGAGKRRLMVERENPMVRLDWSKALCLGAGLLMAGLLWSGRLDAAEGQPMILPADPAPLVVVTKTGERSFTVEVADDPAERQAGLMFRKDMADDHGMLFVFEATQPLGFWMKNTIMPLDLIFIGPDGRIRAIRKGEPFSEAVISPDEPVRFVLELKAGTAAKEGIEDGDLVRHPRIAAAPVPGEQPPRDGAAPNADDGEGSRQ